MNASVRVVHAEDNALSYAPADDMLAVVLYLNQKTDAAGNAAHEDADRPVDRPDSDRRRPLLSAVPASLFSRATDARLSGIAGFFQAKREIDPGGLFTSTFYERFGTGR